MRPVETPATPGASLLHRDDDEGHVVLKVAVAELGHRPDDRVLERGRSECALRADELEEPVLAKLRPIAIPQLGDTVREEHQPVTGLQIDPVLNYNYRKFKNSYRGTLRRESGIVGQAR